MALTFPISASIGQTYQSGSSNTYEWTGTYWKIKNITSQNFVTRNEYNHLSSSAVIFDINNNINLKGAGVIKNKSDNKTVNIVGNNFVQLQWTTDAGLAEADPNSTTQPTNWAYIDSDGFHIETNVNQSGSSNHFDFNNNGNFVVGGNQIISGSVNIDNPTQPSISIGDSFKGGKVAYILQSGDVGYDPNLIKGIIAAESDEPTTLSWADAYIACDNKTTNGYTDWYLPNWATLYYILYVNRAAIGGFTSNVYWSQTQVDFMNYQGYGFGDNSSYSSPNTYTYYVRAVRNFSIPKGNALNVTGNTSFSGSLNVTGSLILNGNLTFSDSSIQTTAFVPTTYATTGSNQFIGTQIITGSNGVLEYSGTMLPDEALASIHAKDEAPWLERFYNDSFSTTNSVMSYFAWNDGRFIFHNDSTESIAISVGGYESDNLIVRDNSVDINRNVNVSGSIIPATADGTYTSSFSLGSATNAWKDLYISHGSIIFVDAQTQETSSFSIDNNAGQNTVKYTANITASAYLGDGGQLINLPSATNWNNIYDQYLIRKTEQLTFSGDYILENAFLLIEGSETQIEYSPNKYFKKEGTIFIGGNLLLKDSRIQNNGKISVGGQVILIGNSEITGTGTII